MAGDQRCDCLAAGEVAEVAQVVVGQVAFGGVDGGADTLYVFCGCGQGRVDVAVLTECADICADVFCAVEAGVGEGVGDGVGFCAVVFGDRFECFVDVHVLVDEAQVCLGVEGAAHEVFHEGGMFGVVVDVLGAFLQVCGEAFLGGFGGDHGHCEFLK
ncbi:Uncharacterised protein [Mycobacterium tuberculosis]|nr:Uncharacterised protein [Mycobacterium tuberculosis]